MFHFLGTIATVTTRMHCGLLYVLHIIISSLCAKAVGTMVHVRKYPELEGQYSVANCIILNTRVNATVKAVTHAFKFYSPTNSWMLSIK